MPFSDHSMLWLGKLDDCSRTRPRTGVAPGCCGARGASRPRSGTGAKRDALLTEQPREPRVSLLMPNRNNAGILGHVLERLSANTTYSEVELVVVDDGSTDRS